MSYHIYVTKAHIIDSYPVGEANKFYVLFARELGVIWATAQGVRLAKSKLRPLLEPYRELSISLVRGKDTWRITDVEVVQNFQRIKNNKELKQLVATHTKLIRRLVHGETEIAALYDFFIGGLSFLENTKEISRNFLVGYELLISDYILSSLGYGNDEIKSPEIISQEAINFVFNKKDVFALHIKKALESSHL